MNYPRSKGMAASGKVVNRLSVKQIFELCRYLEDLQPTFDTSTTRESLAIKASEHFQLTINQFNIKTALETAEIELPKPPKTEVQRIAIIKAAIENVYESLEMALPAEWKDL
jgi:hypothetical protein